MARFGLKTYWKTGVAMPAPPGSDLRHKCPVTREHLSNELQAGSAVRVERSVVHLVPLSKTTHRNWLRIRRNMEEHDST